MTAPLAADVLADSEAGRAAARSSKGVALYDADWVIAKFLAVASPCVIVPGPDPDRPEQGATVSRLAAENEKMRRALEGHYGKITVDRWLAGSPVTEDTNDGSDTKIRVVLWAYIVALVAVAVLLVRR